MPRRLATSDSTAGIRVSPIACRPLPLPIVERPTTAKHATDPLMPHPPNDSFSTHAPCHEGTRYQHLGAIDGHASERPMCPILPEFTGTRPAFRLLYFTNRYVRSYDPAAVSALSHRLRRVFRTAAGTSGPWWCPRLPARPRLDGKPGCSRHRARAGRTPMPRRGTPNQGFRPQEPDRKGVRVPAPAGCPMGSFGVKWGVLSSSTRGLGCAPTKPWVVE